MDKQVFLHDARTRFEAGENPTVLMNVMESFFEIPAMNNEEFNKKNPEVMALYRKISNSRF